MRIVLAMPTDGCDEDEGSMVQELREHFAWVKDGVGPDFFARLHAETQVFMQTRGPFYVGYNGEVKLIKGLKGMVTNSALTFYPQFDL